MPMPTVALDVPSAHVLADQASIISELQFVMDCSKRLLDELAKPLEERDQLAARAANPAEGARVGAALSPPEQKDRRVEGIVIFASSHEVVNDTGVRQLGGLASELAKQTAAKAQEQQDVVLKDAQQLNLDSLYQQEPIGTWPPGEPEDSAAD